MYIDNHFKIALLISLGIHSSCLLAMPQIKHFNLRKKSDKKIEVTYVKEREPLYKIQKNAQIKIPENLTPPPYPKTEEAAKNSLAQTDKPEIKVSREENSIKPKINFPDENHQKIRSPEYANYYRLIREKIKSSAYQEYEKRQIGEVFVSFSISSNGSLQTAALVEEKSSPSQYLRDTALKSIRHASPFPPFPKELNYQQLSFNIIISFETDN